MGILPKNCLPLHAVDHYARRGIPHILPPILRLNTNKRSNGRSKKMAPPPGTKNLALGLICKALEGDNEVHIKSHDLIQYGVLVSVLF